MTKKQLKSIKLAKFYFSKSFSFPEVIVTLFIVSVALVVFLTLASEQFLLIKSAEERLIANILVLEGIELVQAYRNSQIDQNNWLGALSYKGIYCIHFVNNSFFVQPLSRCRDRGRLYLVNNNYLHNQNADKTLFRREIEIQDYNNVNKIDLSDSNFVKVVSRVSFRDQVIKLEIVLTKWHPRF